ncbi:phosphate ABC transporter, inner membrane subunit PstC, partial [mine drainage metagenome]
MNPIPTQPAERAPVPAGQARGSGYLADRLFEWMTRIFALLVLFTLLAILASLVVTSAPSLKAFGFSFLWSEDWDPVQDKYGALIPVYGTLVSSFVALLIAVPISFGIAVFLTEMSPPWLKRPLGTAIELLAAIPSIIYGMWGLFSFAPIFSRTLQPFLIQTLGKIPFAGQLFQGPPLGIGLLTASIILAIMVIPFISSVMRDVFELVPVVLKES